MSSGWFCRSPSIVTRISPRARVKPACIAGCCPKLRVKRTARTRGSRSWRARRCSNVMSLEPSSTKSSSNGRLSTAATVRSYSSPTVPSSLSTVTTIDSSGLAAISHVQPTLALLRVGLDERAKGDVDVARAFGTLGRRAAELVHLLQHDLLEGEELVGRGVHRPAADERRGQPVAGLLGDRPEVARERFLVTLDERRLQLRTATREGLRPVPPDVKFKATKAKKKQLVEQGVALGGAAAAEAASTTPPIGTVRPLVATNFNTGSPFLTNATLRGVGNKVEIWVQNNRAFPAGDCRNADPADLAITDQQVASLVAAFDHTMFPIESSLFSVAPDRDGSKSLLPFDYIHRQGANPPNDPVAGSEQACKSRPAFPYRMESTFAHEYQHLLEYYASPGEYDWVNEGLSDFAMRKTGFARPEIPQRQIGSEGHIQCFFGNLGSTLGGIPLGGPENGLTWWGDQPNEITCDYGAAWSFMEYLEGRFGEPFMTALHNEDKNGFAGLQAVLDQFLTGRTAQDVVHEWLAAVALDNALDAQT